MQIAEAHNTGIYVLLINLTRRASRKSPAEWSLEVADFDQRHRRARIALEVARRRNRLRHLCGGARRALWRERGDGLGRDGNQVGNEGMT